MWWPLEDTKPAWLSLEWHDLVIVSRDQQFSHSIQNEAQALSHFWSQNPLLALLPKKTEQLKIISSGP